MRSWSGFAILLAGVLAAFSVARADPQLPARIGAVVDAANIIRPSQEQALAVRAAKLQSQWSVELVVVTLPSLQGYSIERWGRDLGNGWNVGGTAARGVLLIVAPNDRELRIEVGDGLASLVTDRKASSIIDNAIVPQFRHGEMSGGILAGVDAIADAVAGLSSDVPEAPAMRTYFDGLGWETIRTWIFWSIIPLLIGYQVVRYVYQNPGEVLASFRQSTSTGGDRSSRSGFFSSGGSRSRSSGRSSRGFSGRGASGRW